MCPTLALSIYCKKNKSQTGAGRTPLILEVFVGLETVAVLPCPLQVHISSLSLTGLLQAVSAKGFLWVGGCVRSLLSVGVRHDADAGPGHELSSSTLALAHYVAAH